MKSNLFVIQNLMQHFIALMIFLNVTSVVFSQSSKLQFQNFKVNDENFDSRTNVVFEDSYGFMWFGTNNGLYRYNGHALKEYQYDVFDDNSISNNTINSIVEDKNQNLWIGTESYLVFYNRINDSFKGYYKNNTTTLLGKTKDELIWVNIWKKGLFKIIPGADMDSLNIKHYEEDAEELFLPKDKRISCYFEDAYGRIWLGIGSNLVLFNENGETHKITFPETIQKILPAGQNSFLMATNKGVYEIEYRKENQELEILDYYALPEEVIKPKFSVSDMVMDVDKRTIWIATNNGLIQGTKENNTYSFKLLRSSNEKGSLNSNNITSLNIDNFDNLWIGTTKGINKVLDQTSIVDYHRIASDTQTPNALFIDNRKIVWTGASDGTLSTYAHDTDSFAIAAKIPSAIHSIKWNYNQDEILVGSRLALYTSKGFSTQNKFELELLRSFDNAVKDLVAINKNEIWVGLWSGGIDIINPSASLSSFKKNLITELAGFNISALHLAKNKNLWIGTRGQGVYKVDFINEIATHYLPSKSNGLSSNAILCFLETEQGLYLGTRGGGLNNYDNKTNSFKSYNKANGFKSNTIASMQSDRKGNIWLSTRNGLARFDEVTKSIVNFTSEDGVDENQFVFNASGTNDLGTLYFATLSGIYEIYPEAYHKNEKIANTLIASVKVMGTESTDGNTLKTNISNTLSDSTEALKLNHEQNNLWFEFSSLDLTNSNKNEYAYMMEGVNDYWIHTGSSNRNANYNGLKPGNYVFKVKSTNSHGVWNEEATTVKIMIAPPFWLSNVAISLYVLGTILLLSTGLLLVRRWYRLKKNLVTETISRQKDNEHHKMKMVFFTDISHELKTPLSLIQGTIEKVINTDYHILPDTAKRIHNNALRMGRLIKQIMDIRKFDVGQFKIKVSKGNIVEDVLNLKNAFNDFAKIYKIKFEFHCAKESINAYYDFRILEKVVFNLLSNAFKYTFEGGRVFLHLKEVQLDMTTSTTLGLKPGSHIKCSVKDNGAGIPEENLRYIFDRYYQSTKTPTNQIPGTGIGMELVHKLINSHRGTIKVESEENNFTEFTFWLPIQKNRYLEDEFLMEHETKKPSIITRSDYQVFDEITTDGVHQKAKTNNSRSKVLLVEDNDEIRLMLKEELITEFDIIEASNGIVGYKMVEQETPDLIISDILMPEEDGISMLKRIKANDDFSTIPVFILTARDSHEVKLECLAIGAADFIEKPFSPEFVRWKAKNLLGSQKELKDRYSKTISVKTSEIELKSNDEKLIKKLIIIVENSIDDTVLSVEYLANEVGMSRANLYRKLQAIINDTPVNFIKQIRLKRACQLLKKNNLYISEVAYMTGFSNHKYFTKCFSKEFGMSPTEYAKKSEQKEKTSYRSDLAEMVSKIEE